MTSAFCDCSGRRGYTLIEVFVVISVIAIITTMAAGLLLRMTRLDAVAEAAVQSVFDLQELERLLNSDLRAAKIITVDNRVLTLQVGDVETTYHVESGRLLRREGRAEQALSHPPGSFAWEVVSSDGPRPLLLLTLRPEATSNIRRASVPWRFAIPLLAATTINDRRDP